MLVLIQLTCSCQEEHWQWSRAVDTTIDSTSNTFDRREEFVASDAISWRPGKFSWLEMVLLDCEQSANHFMKDSRKLKKDFRKSRVPIEDLDFSDQAFTLLALLCKDEACANVRSAEDGNGDQVWQALLRARTVRYATNLLNQLMQQTNSHVTRPTNQPSTVEQNAEEYATRTGERVSDCIRRAVYINEIAPQDMRQHLMLNQSV